MKLRNKVAIIIILLLGIVLFNNRSYAAQSWVSAGGFNFTNGTFNANGDIQGISTVKVGSMTTLRADHMADWGYSGGGSVLHEPNVYCVQHGQEIYGGYAYHMQDQINMYGATANSTYTGRVNFADAAKMAYLLSYSNGQYKNDYYADKVQQALWDYFPTFLKQAQKAGVYQGEIPSSSATNPGLYGNMLNASEAYKNYAKNYKKPSSSKTNPTLTVSGNTYRIGPLNVDYTTGSYGGKLFGGIWKDECKLYDQNNNEITGWSFVQNNKTVEVPASGNFYIEFNKNKNPNVTQVKKIRLKMSHLYTTATLYNFRNAYSTGSQCFILVSYAKATWRNSNLDININVTLEKPAIKQVKNVSNVNYQNVYKAPTISVDISDRLNPKATVTKNEGVPAVRKGYRVVYRITQYSIGTVPATGTRINDTFNSAQLKFLASDSTNTAYQWKTNGTGKVYTDYLAGKTIAAYSGGTVANRYVEIAFEVIADPPQNGTIKLRNTTDGDWSEVEEIDGLAQIKVPSAINGRAISYKEPLITVRNSTTKNPTFSVTSQIAPKVEYGDLITYKVRLYNISSYQARKGERLVDVFDPNQLEYQSSNGSQGWSIQQSGRAINDSFVNSTINGCTNENNPPYLEKEITFRVIANPANVKVINNSTLDNTTTIKLGINMQGITFIDEVTYKDQTVGMGELGSNDTPMDGVQVTLYYSNGGVVTTDVEGLPITNPIYTSGGGRYGFYGLDGSRSYYLRFKYDGQNFEPTTYKRQGINSAKQSYATDGYNNRNAFNRDYMNITGPVATSRDIYAYTGSNGINALDYYTGSNVTDKITQIHNLNFGMVRREDLNLNLTKDINKIQFDINGKTQIYNQYNQRIPDKLSDQIFKTRGTDFNIYEREIRKSDVAYSQQNGNTSLRVEYKIRIQNYMLGGFYKGGVDVNVSNLLEYFPSGYQYKSSYGYSDPTTGQKQLSSYYIYSGDKKVNDISTKWVKQADKYGYQYMTTTALNNLDIEENKYVDVYITLEVTPEAMRKVLQDSNVILENFSEIGGYRTTYHADRVDLNGKKISYKDDAAGLVDKYSTPNNFNPSVFNSYLNSEEYRKNTTTAQKRKDLRNKFEYDADKAAGLKIQLTKEERALTGTVFEDKTSINTNKERLGNGRLDSGENKIQNATIELVNTAGQVVNVYNGNSFVPAVTKADRNGNYRIEGYIPGDYKVRFRYGDTIETATKYNGQDYKSTIINYDEVARQSSSGQYWYEQDNKNTRNSDGVDDLARRKQVNSYIDGSAGRLNNYKANILNNTLSNQTDKNKLIEMANMYSNTDRFVAEVEYVRKTSNVGQNSDYAIINIDFGIAERAQSELTMKKEVENLTIVSSTGETLFNSSKQQQDNLAWRVGNHIQATMDDALLHGATVKILYRISIENTGETDYILSNGNIDTQYYKKGIKSSNSQKVTTQATAVLDYIANNLVYDQESSYNTMWETVQRSNLQVTPRENSLVNNDINLTKWQRIVKAKDTSTLREKLTPGQKVDTTLFVSKVLANNSDTDEVEESKQDDYTYKNKVEIVEVENKAGRRSYTTANKASIPGNLDPNAATFTKEVDSAKAETVSIIPPFGNSIIYYTIGTLILAIVIAGGIILIKRKNKEK